MRMVSRVLSVLLSLSILTACAGHTPPVIKTILLYPPISYDLLSCDEEPVPGDIKTQEEFAIWAEQVRTAGENCRGQLGGLRTFISSWENDVNNHDAWTQE